MNNSNIRTAVASMVLGIVSVSLCLPAMLFPFFWWILGAVISAVSLICGILAIILGARAKLIRPAGRAVAGFVLGIVGTSIAGLVILSLLILRIIF